MTETTESATGEIISSRTVRYSMADMNPVGSALDLAERMLLASAAWDYQDRSAARVLEALANLRNVQRGSLAGGRERPDDPAKVMDSCATKMRNVGRDWSAYWNKNTGDRRSRHLDPDDFGRTAELLQECVLAWLRNRREGRQAAELSEMSEEKFAGYLAFGLAMEAGQLGAAAWSVLPACRDISQSDRADILTEPCFQVFASRRTGEADEDLAERMIVECARAAGRRRPSALFDGAAKRAKRTASNRRSPRVRTR